MVLQLPGDSSFSSPLPNSQAHLEEKVSDTAALYVIDTGFDFTLKENLSTAGHYRRGDPEDEYRYTQFQRKSAAQAVEMSSLSDLHQKVRLLF
jgi:hypothetical protein